MAIIDPHTGRPMGNPQSGPRPQGVPTEALVQAIQIHEQKINATTQQVIHLGIFVEYIVQQLQALDVQIDLEAFQEYAQLKWKELHEEQEQRLQEAKATQAAGPIKVNLDE